MTNFGYGFLLWPTGNGKFNGIVGPHAFVFREQELAIGKFNDILAGPSGVAFIFGNKDNLFMIQWGNST